MDKTKHENNSKTKAAASPEQINEYIRVTTPAVWLVLGIAVVTLVAILIWGVFGELSLDDGEGVMRIMHPITYVTN